MSVLFRRFHILYHSQKIRYFSDATVRRSVLVLGVHNLFQKSQTLTPLSSRINEELNGQLINEIEKIKGEHVSSDKFLPAVILRSIKYRSYYKIHLVNLPVYTPTPISISNTNSSALLSLGFSVDQNAHWGEFEHLRYSDWVRRQSALALIHNKKDFLHLDPMCDPRSVAEGATLASFNFNLKSENKEKDDATHFSLFDEGGSDLENWNKGIIIAQMQNFARMLSELPSNLLDPAKFVDEALSQVSQLGTDSLTYEVKDPSWIESNLPSVHHVAKGSKTEPRFLTLSYKGAKATEDTYVIVGKGVVFDSGGISLKPPASMELMRGDMSGAAVALSTLIACAKLKSPVNLVCLIPLVENMPSSSAIKPGDLITMHNGKTVIVNNTDAEGRLILADTLSYAKKFNPKLVVNVATLTGASDIALGDSYSALFSNSNALSDKLSLCGAVTGEFLWPMPIHYDYLAALRKSNADLDNISSGRSAGSGVGAAFLSEFVSFPWAHIDIGGTMMQKSGSIPYLKTNIMSGRPTRALIEFFTDPTLSSYDFVQTPKPYILTTDKYQPISD